MTERPKSFRSVSGIKPTGTPHLGNYLGMIQPALKLQQTQESFYFIADYHALTTLHSPPLLQQYTYELVATFVALGMDYENHVFFRQSDIPEVTELTWYLSCVTSKGLLERGHAYKDAKNKSLDITHGIFSYPVLMAADILLYDATHVPVGKDQKQHLEITRDIAIRFNHLYGETFVIPEAFIEEKVATIPGVDGQKMSKSYDNTLPLFTTEKKLRKSIMKIVTDSKSVEESKNPESCHVFQLYSLFATKEQSEEMAHKYRAGGYGYGEAKQALFELINHQLGESRETYFSLIEKPTTLEEILQLGKTKAKRIASAVIDRVRSQVGL